MNEWKEAILSEKVDLIHGHQFRDSDFVESGVPIIKIGQLKSDGRIDLSECSFVDRNQLDKFKDFIIQQGDILMALTGATLGKTVKVTKSVGIVFQNYRVGKFLPKDSSINTDFLYYVLTSDDLQNEMLSKINTAAQGNIGKSDFEKIKIKFPPFDTQAKIARILSTCDAVIEKTQQAIAKYKAIKQGMLHDLFTRGIDLNTSKLRPRYEDAPELYKESKLGRIPKEWEVERLEELCSQKPTYGINAAAVDFTHLLPVYIRITDIDEDGNFTKVGRKCVNSQFSINYILKKGDIVFARTGATVGKTYLYKESDGVLVYAGFLIKVSPSENMLDSDFLKFLAETPYYWNWVEIMSQRSGQPGINGNEYGKLPIPKPFIDEQKSISSRLLTIQNKLQSEQSYLQKLQAIKQGLMSDLLSGRKRVNAE